MRSQGTTARHGRGRRRAFTTAFCSLLVFAMGLGQAVIPAANAGAPTLTMGQVQTTSQGTLAAAAAVLAGGAVSLDFIAAGHTSYNHTTGVGGAYNNRTIGNNGVEESLEGQDFACGDKIVYFVAVKVDAGAANGDVDLNLSWDGTTTSGSMVGINDLVSATLNSPDTGNKNLDGNETVSIHSETGPPPAGTDVKATVRVTGLDGSEQLIVRLVTNLWCDPFETSVTGNIHANLDSASVVGGSKISVGAQTVPLKQAGNILFPGLNVLKTCPATGSVGGTISYQITVENTGEDTLNNIQVDDTILGDLSASFADSLAGGATEAHTFSYTLTGTPDPITNVVTATATAAQSSTELSDTADCTTDVLFPNLGIQKTADNASVNAGEPIGYTITVTNSGEGKAFDVVMTDTLPTNPGLNWSVGTTTGGWKCAIDAGVLTCGGKGFDLAPGTSASVHITSPTTSATCGTVSNTGIADASNTTQVSTGIVTIEVKCAALAISKVADASVVSAGDTIGYTITVTNNGAGTAKGVVVHDTLPTNGGLAWTIDAANSDAGCSITTGVLTCNFGDMATGTSKHVHLTSPTTAATCGQVVNAASATTTNDGNPSTGNVPITVNCPDVSVLKTADNGTINAGDTAAFTIVVTNNGPGTAYGVTLNDPLPAGVAWTEDSASCSIANNTLSCQFGTMTAGATRTVHVSGKTDAADCGLLHNTATVSASNEGTNTKNNTSTADITVDCPDLTVLKTADNGTINAGDTAAFTITVTNNGDGTAYGVTLTDTLPAGVAWQTTDKRCVIAAGVLTCDLGDMASGASTAVHVSGSTDTTDCGVLRNTATVSSDNQGPVSSSADITVECPSISVIKTADAETVDAADLVGFTITVANAGPGTAYDVMLADTLPTNDGLDWSIDDGTGAEFCDIADGVLTCDFGDMGAESSYTVHITSDTDHTTCGVIDNTATVTISNGEGDSDDASIAVNCPPLGIDIRKGGPDLAHVGDTITYTFDVSLTTAEPLLDVTVTDPNCDEGAPVYVSGDDGDNVLEPEETWTYTCTHVVTSEDPDPLPNTATVEGTSDDGRTTTDEDSHEVDLIHPAIEIVKTVNPISGEPGDTVTYSYEVTNTGDTTLYDVSVDDDIIGHIGDIAELAADETVTLTKDWVLPSSPVVITNVGTATGTDVLGKTVSANDDAIVTIVLANNPPKPPPPTAFTGSDAMRLGLVALALLAMGLFALALGRRRGRHGAH